MFAKDCVSLVLMPAVLANFYFNFDGHAFTSPCLKKGSGGYFKFLEIHYRLTENGLKSEVIWKKEEWFALLPVSAIFSAS
jgi:hypothetical protein